MGRRRQAVLRGSAAFAVAVGYGALSGPPAEASAQPIRIVGTNNIGVGIRPAPDMGQPIIGGIPEGQSPDYHCYVRGQNVGGTDVWFYVTYGGVTGYYTSFYDDVPLEFQADLEGHYGIPRCDVQASASAPAPPSTDERINVMPGADAQVLPAPTVYNRQAAVSWALEHVRDIQSPRYPGCTWFVSQALWYGGLHETESWHSKESPPWALPGTPTATAVVELVKHLKSAGLIDKVPLFTDTTNRFDRGQSSIPEAKIGDVIAYDWTGDGTLDHLAFIVDIVDGSYPLVSEWGTLDWDDVDRRVGYDRRGWTWSEKEERWLAEYNPGIKATLLRITAQEY